MMFDMPLNKKPGQKSQMHFIPRFSMNIYFYFKLTAKVCLNIFFPYEGNFILQHRAKKIQASSTLCTYLCL